MKFSGQKLFWLVAGIIIAIISLFSMYARVKEIGAVSIFDVLVAVSGLLCFVIHAIYSAAQAILYNDAPEPYLYSPDDDTEQKDQTEN